MQGDGSAENGTRPPVRSGQDDREYRMQAAAASAPLDKGACHTARIITRTYIIKVGLMTITATSRKRHKSMRTLSLTSDELSSSGLRTSTNESRLDLYVRMVPSHSFALTWTEQGRSKDRRAVGQERRAAFRCRESLGV